MTKENQEKVRTLYISPEKQEPSISPIIWHHTGTAFNDMGFGITAHVDSRRLWESGEVNGIEASEDIEKITIVGDIPDYEFIGQLTQLKSLAIISSKTFNHLHLIENLENLQYLQIISCHQVSDITPIINLRNRQLENRIGAHTDESEFKCKHPLLQNIALVDCNISSLEPFRQDKSSGIEELHLRWNHIRDIEPLGVMGYAYLDLSHNHIEDIAPLFSSKDKSYYGINLRHNLIKDISGIDISSISTPGQIKLWMNHNTRIPLQQLLKWRENKQLWIMDMELKKAKLEGAAENKNSSKPD